MHRITSVVLGIFLTGLIGMSFAANAANELVGIKFLPLPDKRVRVIFEFRENLKNKPASFVMKEPAKIVFDFLLVKDGLNAENRTKEINIGVLKKYSIISSGTRTRAVLDLTNAISYSTSKVGKQFSITLAGNKKKKLYKHKETFYANRRVNLRHNITSVDFRGTGKSGGELVVGISDPNMNVDVMQRGKRIILQFLNTSVPRRLIRGLDVSDFHTPAKAINSYQKGRNVQFVISTKGDFGQFAYQINKKFVVEVFPLTPEEVAKAKLKKKVYTGKRISLNFQNIQVRAVLQLLAEFTGKNMVVSDTVTGNITLRLNKVPWDQALAIILKTRGLDTRKMGDVIMIAPTQEIAAQEKQELAVQTQSKALAPLLSELMQINYAKAADVAALITSKGSTLLSPRGTVSVDSRTNSLWIQDTSMQLGELKELINKLDIPVRQVLIEARVVTVNKDFEKDLGVRFGVSKVNNPLGINTHLSGTVAGASATHEIPAIPLGNVPVPQRLNLDLPAPVTSGTPASIGLALAKLGDGILLDLELSALESEGNGELVASPRLITANQQSALIEAGEEIPYQEATSSGATAIAFKQAVLSLKVTPQITPDNKIILDLVVNQDTASNQRFNGVPAILTKQIETNVLVGNGQTIVLGGIYKQDKKQAINRVPFLGDFPLIGGLFRNTQEIIKHEELLIFITPKIIKHSFSTT